MSNNIIVIGAGVSGITTALTLQLLGYETEIITAQTPSDVTDKNSHPEFASLYPSASVIPHSVYSDHLKELFQHSQSFFYELRKLIFPGLTIHKHYEIFENEQKQPEYCSWMPNLKSIGDLDPNEIPRRSKNGTLHGWVFNCIFADWPLYLPALFDQYRKAGGIITHKKLEHDDITELPAERIINCSGVGGPSLFIDPSDEQLLMRGHLLHKSEAQLITSAGNEIVSYNYTPNASVYADANGDACDVYCYPRKDGWILGGSRQSATLGDTNWDHERSEQATYEIDSVSFPRQIIDLNREILETTFGVTLQKSDPLSPTVGYRYIRNRTNGLRLDQEEFSDKKIYHNYGHGGAGVTLSWGCALKIAEQITTENVEELKASLIKELVSLNFHHYEFTAQQRVKQHG